MTRAAPHRCAACFAAFLSIGPFSGCARTPDPGDPIAGLSKSERDRFERGRVEFERTFTAENGLGPLFNAESCAECHESPVVGGPGDEVEIHVGALAADFCDPLVHEGGPVVQQHATPALAAAMGIDREPHPPSASRTGLRTTPDVLGFGLLDAVPDSVILAYADADDRDGDGISGRPNRFFDGRVGRFGRKALVPTLREFNDGAFVIEQGITNPVVPTEESIGGQPVPAGVDPVPEPEVGQETLDLVDDFVRFLAPPAPQKLTETGKRGRRIFDLIGCDGCHVPTLVTGNHPVRALRDRKVSAYTDLLLHDMGADLADICFGLATESEFRTEPLMGLRFSEQIEEGEPRFLHDGRATTVDEAIRFHGGEASRARDRYTALSDADRNALLEFLRSL
jgi:CxxC motif-containing protein (DUF1111 family)